MTRVFKIFGVSGLTLLAIGALWSASASATEFHSESTTTKTTSEQDASGGSQVITAAGGSITCSEARFESTNTTKAATELTLKPLLTTSGTGTGFSGCTFFGVSVTVNMHTCDFVFQSTGSVEITGCSGTQNYISYKATVLGASCEVRMSNQVNLDKATYTNIGSGTTSEVTTDIAINGIQYDAIGSLCNPAGFSQTNGSYSGKITSTAEVDGTTTHTGVSFG